MKGNFVYFFYNHSNTLFYVGKTSNITERMKVHLSPKCIKDQPWKESLDRKNIILYECENPTDLEIYETYFINKYRPIHNRGKYYKEIPSFDLPYLEPVNPFLKVMEFTQAYLSLWKKANRSEKDAFLIVTGIKRGYLSLDNNRDIYLDESKYGQIYPCEQNFNRYQSEE